MFRRELSPPFLITNTSRCKGTIFLVQAVTTPLKSSGFLNLFWHLRLDFIVIMHTAARFKARQEGAIWMSVLLRVSFPMCFHLYFYGYNRVHVNKHSPRARWEGKLTFSLSSIICKRWKLVFPWIPFLLEPWDDWHLCDQHMHLCIFLSIKYMCKW